MSLCEEVHMAECNVAKSCSTEDVVIKRKSKRKNSSNVEKIESKPQDKKEQ